ncbi:MAG: glycosyltransferase family 39 protein [Candidatus Moraniibacteriota bacterium]
MNPSRLWTRSPWLIALSGFVLALILALALALFGWFYPALTWVAGGLLLGGFGLALFVLYQECDWARLGLIGALVLFALLIALRTEPTVFTGRDQGSIALAAWELAHGHELAFRTPVSDAFFAIYGPGRALNFPGFSYTESGALITQFPLGYISYLALFVQWFGPTGLLIANALLFILSSWTFFDLGSLFVTRHTALFGTALFSTSFFTVWLTQMTLTENLALLLFLTLTVALIRLAREDDRRVLPCLLITGFLLALTRIEGFVIAPLALGFILWHPKLRAHLFALPKVWAIPVLLFLGFLFLRDLFMNLPFYTMIGKAALKYWHTLGIAGTGSGEPRLGPILISYGLFPVFILGLASLAFGIMRRRFALLIPVLLALPTFVYLFDGHISDDHPWLLRRYVFTLFPLFLLATIVLWQSMIERIHTPRKHTIALIGFGLLFVLQCWPAYQALSVIEYQTLRAQAENFGDQFTARDLILIDRESSGDPFAMIAGPLMSLDGKSAAYFFNPEDYARLDRNAFDRVYLLTTEDTVGQFAATFGDRLLPVEVLSFVWPTLTAPRPFARPIRQTVTRDAILFEITD